MEISDKLAHSSFWVNNTVRDLEKIVGTFSILKDDSIESNDGNKVTIKEQALAILNTRKSFTKSSNEDTQVVSPLKLDYVKEHKVMENQLAERLDILKEAINILNDTETNAEKLRYMTNNISPNPHLVDIGYENVVLNYLREELVEFNRKNKLNYFTVKTFVRDFGSYKNIGLNVKLKGFDKIVFLFTEVELAVKDVHYPKNIGITSGEHEIKNQIEKATAEYNNLTSEIKAYNIVINDLENNLLSKNINKKGIKRYKLFINDSNKELARYYALILELQEELLSVQNTLTRFYKEIPKIEKEQDMIFEYISELFDTKVFKNSLVNK